MSLLHIRRQVSLILILLPFFNAAVNAQNTCEYGYLTTPDAFKSYVKESVIEDIRTGKKFVENMLKSTNEICWYVYSDRASNKMYKDPDGYDNSIELDFLQKAFVKSVKGNWLNLYSINDKNLGWIKADKVLLSSYTLLNEKSFPKKALVLITIPKVASELNEELLKNKFYKSPYTTISNESGARAKKFDIYFIAKQEQGAVLLLKADNLNSKSNKSLSISFGGWMPKANITNWDHRLCLEPSSARLALNSYGDKQLPVFSTEENLSHFLSTQFLNEEDAIKLYSLSPKRPDPYNMRMPILKNIDENVKQVATIASFQAGNEYSEGEKSEAARKLQTVKDKLQNINIVFAIDGTQSMKNYYQSVANSIEHIIDYNEKKNSSNSIKFGLIVYRDYADAPKDYEVYPLTSDIPSILRNIRSIECTSKDNDLPEAQFNGLINGIPKVGFVNGQSNVLVLVGDCGNHNPDKKYKKNDVYKVFAQYELSLVAFQVISGIDISYLDFSEDIRDYILETAKISAPEYKPSLTIPSKGDNTSRLYFESVKGDIPDDLFMFGKYSYAQEGERMSLATFEKNINQSLDDYIERVDEIKANLELVAGGAESKSGVYTEAFKNYLRKLGFTDRQIGILIRAGDVNAIGFLSTKYYGNDKDWVDPVVFLSESEKKEMEDRLNKLLRKLGGTTTKKRQFQETLIRTCQDMLGDVSYEFVAEKTLDEVWDIILGVPYEQDKVIGSYKLSEFDQLVKEPQFLELFDAFKYKAENFTRNSYSDSRFKLSDEYFYWIPLSDFP